jgi:hypothetical protein
MRCSSREAKVMGVRMHGSSLRSEHIFSVVLLSVLVLVTCSAEAQQLPPVNRSASQLPDAPSAVARVLGYQQNLNIPGTNPALHLMPHGRSTWWMSSFRNEFQNHPGLNEHLIQNAGTRMAARWLTFVPSYGRVQPRAIHHADDWQYYGRHIPLAGPVVLRAGHEAQAHPHIVSVFKMIQPQF